VPRNATLEQWPAPVPQISSFHGITIYMYWRDHAPPHFHAQHSEHWAKITIEQGNVLGGSLPPRELRLVEEWRSAHVDELRENWERVQKPEAPNPVEPLP